MITPIHHPLIVLWYKNVCIWMLIGISICFLIVGCKYELQNIIEGKPST